MLTSEKIKNTNQANQEEQDIFEQNQIIQTPGQLIMKRFLRNKLAILGVCIILAISLFSFVGPFFSPYGEYEIFYINQTTGEEIRMTDTDKIKEKNVGVNVKAPMSAAHPLGTDADGRDVLTRLMYGGRISLVFSVVVTIIELLLGVTLGGVAGYYGGKIDYFLMAFTDVFLSIPFLPIVILMGSMLSDLKVNPNMRIVALMFMLGLLSWPSIARLVRGEILSLREQEFMQATESLGLKDTRKIIKHLIPNVIPTIIVNATLGVASAILTESALSYLGMGVVEPTPSWGNMISASNKAIDLQKRPWLWMPPGACMVITVMAVNLFGDALRDALDPKKRR